MMFCVLIASRYQERILCRESEHQRDSSTSISKETLSLEHYYRLICDQYGFAGKNVVE
jgi:hypothetical protein